MLNRRPTRDPVAEAQPSPISPLGIAFAAGPCPARHTAVHSCVRASHDPFDDDHAAQEQRDPEHDDHKVPPLPPR